MAKFFPPTLRTAAPSSERKVWGALSALPNDWSVFANANWQAVRDGRQGDGEADFILLHPKHGAIILEVKGGRLEIEDGVWYSIDRNDVRHQIDDPFNQAKDSKYALITYVRGLQPPPGHIPITHAVVFTDASDIPQIGMNSKPLVIDEIGLAQIHSTLEELIDHWGQRNQCKATTVELERVGNLLAPTLTIRRSLRGEIAIAERELLTLTEQQVGVLNALRANRRCVVRGGAGTGKTLLAMEKARQYADEGARVLLTCYNAPLASWIARECNHKNVLVATFHALCRRQAKEIGMHIPAEPPDEWWDANAADVLGSWSDSSENRYDVVIIDEAQDFSDVWFTGLCMLLSSPHQSPIYVFLDSHQQLYTRGQLKVDGWPIAQLDINCRNTLPIARCVARVFGDDPPRSGASGAAPRFVECSFEDAASKAQEIADQLISTEHFAPKQLAILSDSRTMVDNLRQLVAGGHSLVPVEQNGIPTETIHRFKGLEAEVVIIVLSEDLFAQGAVTNPLLYVGASRGRSLLIVIGPRAAQERLGL